CFSVYLFFFYCYVVYRYLHSFPTRRSSDLFGITINVSTLSFNSSIPSSAATILLVPSNANGFVTTATVKIPASFAAFAIMGVARSEEHTSELQSLRHLVCRLLLEKKKISKHDAEALSEYIRTRRVSRVHCGKTDTVVLMSATAPDPVLDSLSSSRRSRSTLLMHDR